MSNWLANRFFASVLRTISLKISGAICIANAPSRKLFTVSANAED
jgi:hypothetical protein